MHAPHQSRPLSSQTSRVSHYTMTDPGAVVLIDTEHAIAVALHFIITAIATCLITATPRECSGFRFRLA